MVIVLFKKEICKFITLLGVKTLGTVKQFPLKSRNLGWLKYSSVRRRLLFGAVGGLILLSSKPSDAHAITFAFPGILDVWKYLTSGWNKK